MSKKFLSPFLGLALLAQLIVGQTPLIGVQSAWAQSCATGLTWNSVLNRCLTSEQAAKVQDANAQCMKNETLEAQKACLTNALNARVEEAESKGEISKHSAVKGSSMQMLIAFASVLASGYILMTGGKDCPAATSAWLMIGGGVAVLAGEIMSSSTYKKEMKKAEAKLKAVGDSSANSNGSSDNSTATNVQADAFDAMIEKENATIKAGKTKKNLYTVSLAAYAAAAVMAGIEVYKSSWTGGADYCKTASKPTANPTTPEASPAPTGTPAGTPSSTPAPAPPQEGPRVDTGHRHNQVESFITNYFEYKQRVNFHYYLSQDAVLTAQSVAAYAAISTELEMLRAGATRSLSISDYAVMEAQSPDLEKSILDDIKILSVALKNTVLISSAHADASGGATSVAKDATGLLPKGLQTKLSSAADGFKKLYAMPVTRLVLAGILTVNSKMMIDNANKEIKKAEERKAFIEKLRQQILAAGTAFGCSTADRQSNLSKPECYCYNEIGELNPARSKSNTCKAFFGGSVNLAQTQLNSIGASTARNCISATGALDSSCGCRKANSCLSVKTPKVIGNAPAGSVLGTLPETINGLNGGALSAADVNAEKMNALAARLGDARDRLLADPKNKELAKKVKEEQKKADQMVKDLERSLSSSPALASSGFGGSSQPSFMTASNPSDALAKMKEDLKQEMKGYDNAAPVTGASTQRKKDEFSLDALTGGVSVMEEDQANQAKVEEIMAQQYNLSDSEINSDSSADIFQILTNRYQRSALRRLFGAEKVAPADAPQPPVAQ